MDPLDDLRLARIGFGALGANAARAFVKGTQLCGTRGIPSADSAAWRDARPTWKASYAPSHIVGQRSQTAGDGSTALDFAVAPYLRET